MKKTLMCIVMVVASLTRCDQLLDAINKHDEKKVAVLLLQKEYVAANYEQYVTTAHEVVERYKNDMKTQDIEPSVIQKIIVICCVIASSYPMYNFVKTLAEYGLDGTSYADLILPTAQFIGIQFIASWVITIPMILEFTPLCFAYQEAIDVEKLLLEHRLA